MSDNIQSSVSGYRRIKTENVIPFPREQHPETPQLDALRVLNARQRVEDLVLQSLSSALRA